nr:mpv17-like protein 2 [Onthophagus taurus]
MGLKNIIQGLFKRNYSNVVKITIKDAFGKYLLLTNTGTCGVLMLIGDIAQQEIEYQRHMLPERYDWTRLWRMTLVGFGYGPLHHFFYTGIAKIWPQKTLQTVGKKLLADQFIMSPVCISFLFYGVGLLEGNTFRECATELQQKFLEVYTVDWCVWPPVQFVNFYFLPLKYQVLYINTVTMLYNIFLSYMKHREIAQRNLEIYENEKGRKTE